MPIDSWENPEAPTLDGAHVVQLYRTTISTDTGKKGATVAVIIMPDDMALNIRDATTATATTPPAADCRAIVRPIGLSLQAATADGLELPTP